MFACRIKYLILIAALFIVSAMIISCDEGLKVSDTDENFVEFDSSSSVIPDRLQFGKDEVRIFRLSLPTNYLKEDGFSVKASFKKGSEEVGLPLYDDGFSDGLLRDDVAASNNIWSGGINILDFPSEGAWELEYGYFINDTIALGSGSIYPVYVIFNYPPVISSVEGLSSSMIFESGFDTKEISVSVTDSNDTQEPYDLHVLNFGLFNNLGVFIKALAFAQPGVGRDFEFKIDSTFAAGITYSRNYRLRLTTTDMFGESDNEEFTNIAIHNTAPSLYELSYPDTVFIPQSDSIYFSITVRANDPQGHLEYQDIKQVLINLNGIDFYMRDDGNENYYPYNSGDLLKNNGVYTATFKVKSTNLESVYPFTVIATDKVDNISPSVSGTLIFVKNSKKNVIKENDENHYNFASPFKSK
jgi:hypothetical protein